jgi:hypothetical protein
MKTRSIRLNYLKLLYDGYGYELWYYDFSTLCYDISLLNYQQVEFDYEYKLCTYIVHIQFRAVSLGIETWIAHGPLST